MRPLLFVPTFIAAVSIIFLLSIIDWHAGSVAEIVEFLAAPKSLGIVVWHLMPLSVFVLMLMLLVKEPAGVEYFISILYSGIAVFPYFDYLALQLVYGRFTALSYQPFFQLIICCMLYRVLRKSKAKRD